MAFVRRKEKYGSSEENLSQNGEISNQTIDKDELYRLILPPHLNFKNYLSYGQVCLLLTPYLVVFKKRVDACQAAHL